MAHGFRGSWSITVEKMRVDYQKHTTEVVHTIVNQEPKEQEEPGMELKPSKTPTP